MRLPRGNFFTATLLSDDGRGGDQHLIVSPWFARGRPAALASAYNGSSMGGVVFSQIWVAAIRLLGFSWSTSITSPSANPLPGKLLWRDPRFLTPAGMALGLFAQIGHPPPLIAAGSFS